MNDFFFIERENETLNSKHVFLNLIVTNVFADIRDYNQNSPSQSEKMLKKVPYYFTYTYII